MVVPEGFFFIFGIILIGMVIIGCVKRIALHNMHLDNSNNV